MPGEIMDQVINQAHMIIGIGAGVFYPLSAEDLVIGQVDSKVQGNGNEKMKRNIIGVLKSAGENLILLIRSALN